MTKAYTISERHFTLHPMTFKQLNAARKVVEAHFSLTMTGAQMIGLLLEHSPILLAIALVPEGLTRQEHIRVGWTDLTVWFEENVEPEDAAVLEIMGDFFASRLGRYRQAFDTLLSAIGNGSTTPSSPLPTATLVH
jgi:hypothetical protein